MTRHDALLRNQLQRSVEGYLAALDRLSIADVMRFFAPTALFIVQTSGICIQGASAIKSLWNSFFETHESMRHAITSVIVDEDNRRC